MEFNKRCCFELFKNHLGKTGRFLVFVGFVALGYIVIQIVQLSCGTPCSSQAGANEIILSLLSGYLTSLFVYLLTSWWPEYKRSSMQLSIMAEELRYIQNDFESKISFFLNGNPVKSENIEIIKNSIKISEHENIIKLCPTRIGVMLNEFLPMWEKLKELRVYSAYLDSHESELYFRIVRNDMFLLLKEHFSISLKNSDSESLFSDAKQVNDLCKGFISFYSDIKSLRESVIKKAEYYIKMDEEDIKKGKTIGQEMTELTNLLEESVEKAYQIKHSIINNNNNEEH